MRLGRLTLLTFALLSAVLGAQEATKDTLGRDYWVYLPKRIETNRTYWLVVGVHGMGGTGKGAGGFSSWAQKRSDCIVLGPTFPSDGYQFLQKDSDTQLLKLMEELGKRHRLQPKAFVVGFSGGAQFAHRFAHAHPEKVVGVAAHSAGSWSTGGQWGEVNAAARGIPQLVTCGLDDTSKMAPQAPFGRLEWAQAYARKLEADGYALLTAWIPRTSHSLSPEAMRLTEVTFDVAVGGTGTKGPEAERLKAALKRASAR